MDLDNISKFILDFGSRTVTGINSHYTLERMVSINGHRLIYDLLTLYT